MTMARHAKKKTQVAQKTQEYVAVAFARDEAEAREYQVLLTGDNIPAVIKPQAQSDNGSDGYSVMVPEEFVDKAYVIIESQDAYDDFYDMAIDDEVDFDGDVFDDDI
jgi:hypothetical protein